jgi:hypothetical protein
VRWRILCTFSQGGRVFPVRAEPVRDAELLSKVTSAYQVKYHGSSLLRMFSTQDAVAATLRLATR